MEQIIILIVIGLVSTLFGKKGKSDPENSRPRELERPTSRPADTPVQRNEPAGQTDPFKRLKELTGEIYREIQEDQAKPNREPAPAKAEVILQAPRTERTAAEQTSLKRSQKEPRRSNREPSSRSGRLSVHQQESQTAAVHASSNLDISDEQDILKGIIFSEILGPPKSKR